jgi:type II secretory pathway pseudopilin PulG
LKGFTLVEILIIIALLGIIAGIVVVNFMECKDKAQVYGAIASLNHLRTALEMYLLDHDTYPSSLSPTLEEVKPYLGTSEDVVFQDLMGHRLGYTASESGQGDCPLPSGYAGGHLNYTIYACARDRLIPARTIIKVTRKGIWIYKPGKGYTTWIKAK